MHTLKQQLSTKQRIQIKPGEQHVSSDDIILSTILGSCVAACLFDPINKIIGMNHFLLANNRYARNSPLIITESGRYGINAMELLINEMINQGAMKRYMKAKAFGGGQILHNNTDNFDCVGEVNGRFIREFLQQEKIPLLASDLGGEQGRVIHFFSKDYSVYMKKVQKTISIDVAAQEQRYWKRKLKKQTMPDENVELWN